jgi:hypothetical protein
VTGVLKRGVTGRLSCLLAFLFLAGCYLSNTPIYPNADGYRTVEPAFFVDSNATITGIAGGDGMTVAVSSSGIIGFSADEGLSWSKIGPNGTLGTIEGDFADSTAFNDVVYGEGYFLAGGAGGRAAWSLDGQNWQMGTIGPMGLKDIYCVAAGTVKYHKVFVAAGADGQIAWAQDHPEGPWHLSDQTPFGGVNESGQAVRDVAWGRVGGIGTFVAVGDDGRIGYLNDLSGKWYGGRVGAKRQETFRAVAFGNERFLAVGDNGIIMYATDPSTYSWKEITDSGFERRDLLGLVFDPVMSHFMTYSIDKAAGISDYGEKWAVAAMRNLFSPFNPSVGPQPSDESISAVGCSEKRLIFGSAGGALAVSNY